MDIKTIKEKINNWKFLIYLQKNFKDSIFAISNLLIASLDGFFLNVLLVRYLSFEDLGNYKLFFSILNILILFSLNGLGTSVTKAIVKKYKSFYKTAIRFSGLFSLIASVIIILLALSYYKGSDIKMALLLSSFMIPIFFGFNKWEPYYYGEKRFKTIFLLNTLIGGTRFGVCAFILIYFKNYIYTILAYIFIVAAYNLIFYIWISRGIKDEEKDKVKEKGYLKHGFRLTGSSAVSVIAKNIERIILETVSDAATVGIYSAVVVFPNFLKNSLKILVNVPTVKLAARTENENRQIVRKGLSTIFVSGVLIFGVFWFVLPYLLRFFFDIGDPQIIFYGQLLLIPIIFLPANLTIRYLCSYQGSGKSYLKLFTIIDIIKLVLIAIFIPLLQINGIIISLIIAEFIAFVILMIWFSRSNRNFNIK